MDPALTGQDDLSLYTTDYTNDMTSQDPDFFLSTSEPITETSATTTTTAAAAGEGAALPSTATTTTTATATATAQSSMQPPENPTTAITNDNTTNDPATATNPLTFDKNEFSFLPQVQTIVQSILEGDNSDDIGKAVIRLNERIEQARLLLQDLPGLQYVKDEQEAILHQETAILQEMKHKLKKYSRLAAFQ
ncbi:hypothetical protein BCR42DRAFT_425622 [Absidia repens]|uniref:Mediator of RNA polymerase II transcription subunit 9 n=1 Tax=Absidia repens TaxID=90262 RepID=A0A1X2I2B6_9FUNG|nr:hypothetical protein BCR42DRAFT_425622 [Absidia repens]